MATLSICSNERTESLHRLLPFVQEFIDHLLYLKIFAHSQFYIQNRRPFLLSRSESCFRTLLFNNSFHPADSNNQDNESSLTVRSGKATDQVVFEQNNLDGFA
mmetsp:Transcript_6587/g.13298  ORF Transcript_6587/g.13298 Transcript_6587/m.13298 type:complete len:103 (+) Transcript_6587:5697-6005(+)